MGDEQYIESIPCDNVWWQTVTTVLPVHVVSCIELRSLWCTRDVDITLSTTVFFKKRLNLHLVPTHTQCLTNTEQCVEKLGNQYK